ncbi:MAG: hypothetical protein WB951_15315 [Candidatus Sulfotelmatobacter sp.]
MTHLRKIMLEELQRRHYSEGTTRYYEQRAQATKTEASAKPLPMHPALKNALLEWRGQSLYATETDFVFPSVRNKGRKPLDLARC